MIGGLLDRLLAGLHQPESIDLAKVTGIPDGLRWRRQLVVTGRTREGGKAEVLLSVPDVLDVTLHESGRWVGYTLLNEHGQRETTGWWRIPETAEFVEFQRQWQLVPRTEAGA